MSDAAEAVTAQDTIPIPVVRIPVAAKRADLATVFGLALTLALIVAAMMFSRSEASFIDIPSILLVVFGTLTATCTAYTTDELRKTGSVIAAAFFRPVREPSRLAQSLMDIATVARKRGLLALSAYEGEMRKEPFLAKSFQLVVDGYSAEDIDRMLKIEIDSFIERQKRSSSVLRRAAEIAPAMGLIGTLVGLVQMLADLENPEAIGPAMAVALLTTFYGAIMGNIILAPMAVKLDKHTADEVQIMNLILKACRSIVSHENPRSLEMALNGELAPSDQIRYFD
ncbi:MAG: MotA/TolQ/ExbB proton channel family protein [Alphaproteobacteria bacterium]|nr:MotA/TolQ/ExbB proton channel family protein [Alphaproteobacteria bacterium]QQS58469.1 MAG: MotA/TolQ/ExbB proton channel family protein [Alphaproteobacteria bacterium]